MYGPLSGGVPRESTGEPWTRSSMARKIPTQIRMENFIYGGNVPVRVQK